MVIFNTGFYINILPVLVELIINFPEHNKFSEWFYIRKNKYIFICLILLIQFILFGLSMIKPYTVDIIFVNDGENYQNCIMNSVFGKLITRLIEFLPILTHLIMVFLYFIEWNLKESTYETRSLFALSVIDILILLINQFYLHIEFNNYIFSNLFYISEIMIISISNFVIIYLLKLKHKMNGKSSLENLVDEIRKPKFTSTNDSSNIISTSVISNTVSSNYDQKTQTNNSISGTRVNKLISYHYQNSKI